MSNRGSEWGRWDLHVHTKGTARNDQFGDITFEEYCNQLFKKALEKDIRVIGITDYFSLDNFEKVLDFQKDIHNSSFNAHEQERINRICLLPNLELRISPTTGKNTFVNIHLIFNPSLIDDFKNEILSEIKISIDGSESYNLTRQGLCKLGRKFDEKALDDETAYRVGLRKAAVEHGQIIRALHNNKTFNNECLVFVANGSNDGVSGVNSHEGELNVLTTAIYTLADGIFSAKPSDIRFFSTKSERSSYDNIKPCVHGCDAHSLEKLFEPDLQRYCWIKAEPSFEGLKQIIHEIERVKIQTNTPDIKNDYEVIDRIEIQSENIGNQTVYFNQNLNTIIGGRSSGKSTLLKCLAKKLDVEAFNHDKSNDPKTSQFIDELSQNIKVIWKDNKEDDSRQIEYFYQGHMFDKSKEEGIESIIKQILLQRNPELFTQYDEEVANLKILNSQRVVNLDSFHASIKSKIRELQSLGNIADIQAQIEIINKEISLLNIQEISEKEIEQYNTEKVKLATAKRLELQIKNKINEINQLNINGIISLNLPYKEDEISKLVEQNFKKLERSIETYIIEQLQIFKDNSKELLEQKALDVLNRISQIESNEKFKLIESIFQASETLRPLQANKEAEERKLSRIQLLEEEVNKLKQENIEIESQLKATWLEMNKKINSLFSSTNKSIDSSITFEPNPVFMQVEFKQFIDQHIKLVGEKHVKYSKAENLTPKELLSLFEQLISDIKNDTIKLKSGSSEYVISHEFYTSLWFKPIYDVIYEGDRYSEMSQGKKAFVVLKLTLECSDKKCPILIDQPEDDLDNRAIFSELVSYLKDKKTKRQIILATHNANVVVNADSELIIVANQHGVKTPNIESKKFEYRCGSIESMVKNPKSITVLDFKTIREHACEILEGGDQAFKLREKRYHIG